jgi:transcriptional regulator with XRE-family HTH domain
LTTVDQLASCVHQNGDEVSELWEVTVPADDSLARRLRALRVRAFSERVTQASLATALGVSTALISSWEHGSAAPARDRLEAYATYFATPRSRDDDRLLRSDELTTEERADRDALLDELLDLRPAESEASDGPEPTDFWHFPDGAPVRIICGELKDDLPPYADGAHRNFVALSQFADLDSLVELFGHIRSRNPHSDVQFVLSSWILPDHLQAHLVLLGNLAQLQTVFSNWLPADLPVRQVPDRDLLDEDGEVFVVETEDGPVRYEPVPAPAGSTPDFVEDVGFLARVPNPLNRERSLTICSGVFTRGVYGAVRSLTDQQLSEANLAYVRERFHDEPLFGLLMRVKIGRGLIPTPRLDDEDVRLFEFPARRR